MMSMRAEALPECGLAGSDDNVASAVCPTATFQGRSTPSSKPVFCTWFGPGGAVGIPDGGALAGTLGGADGGAVGGGVRTGVALGVSDGRADGLGAIDGPPDAALDGVGPVPPARRAISWSLSAGSLAIALIAAAVAFANSPWLVSKRPVVPDLIASSSL